MASVVSICNKALTLLGSSRIRALTDDSEEARLCNTFYEGVRDAVLQSHPWNCASVRATLARLTDAPAWGFEFAYQLPADCLRVLRMQDYRTRFKVEGSRLLTNENTAKILYIRRMEDPSLLPPLLADLIAIRLAHDIAPRLAKSESKRQEMEQLFEQRAREARSADAQEGSADVLIADEWLIDRAIGPTNPYGLDIDY